MKQKWKMKQKLKLLAKKEILYYLVTLIVLALIMHFDLLSDPLARIEAMKEKGNYFHPFIYSFVVYSVMLVLRIIIDLISKIFEKKSS